MGKFRYVTNRTVLSKAGEEKGRIKVLVKDGSDVAETDYVCPECGFSEHIEPEWKKPFSFKCSKCGFLIRLRRLKDEIKREKKKKKS